MSEELEEYQDHEPIRLRFDYEKVDSSVRDIVESAAIEIKLLERRASEDMVTIGDHLIVVKGLLPYGQFEEWMKIEFDYSPQTGRVFMNVARRFKDKRKNFFLLGQSAIQLLASPSVPDEAIEEAIEIAQEQGSILRFDQAKAISHRYRQAAIAANAEWSESELTRRSEVERGRTVIANMRDDVALIAWATTVGLYERIDRATIWGNPFVVDEDGSREECILKYEDYYFMKSSLWPKLESLRGKVLGCWCYPEDCHGHVLINFLKFDADYPFEALGFGYPIGTPEEFWRFQEMQTSWSQPRELLSQVNCPERSNP